MALCTVASAGIAGGVGYNVIVEVHIGQGLPNFTILGRPDEVCRESRDRIRTAILNSGFFWPSRRITMNLHPAEQRKNGTALDVAMALAVLIGDDQVPAPSVDGLAFIGELALDGRILPVPGVAAMVAALRQTPGSARGHDQGSLEPVVCLPNAAEARLAADACVRVANSLRELTARLTGTEPWPDIAATDIAATDITRADGTATGTADTGPDLVDVRGQIAGRLGLELAASGGHHLLLVGPPGAGKTMLAQRLPGLLPPLDDQTALEATLVHSAASRRTAPQNSLLRTPSFRAPHHSASTVAMVGGGGTHLRPGEVSLAHGGVLFLDELGEFTPSTLDGLRQPLESGEIHIARAETRTILPARFILVGATNPCPCGHGAPGSCVCDESALAKYRRRFSGPLMDRFDLRILVNRPTVDELLGATPGESTAEVRNRVAVTRAVAMNRQGFLNAHLHGDALEVHAPVDSLGRALLRHELECGRLTGRGLHRLRRVARTLADRRGHHDVVEEIDIATALALRAPIGGRHALEG